MTQHNDDSPVPDDGVSRSPVNRHSGARRRQFVAGAAGVAAVLGAGVWAMTAQNGHPTMHQEPQARAPMAPVASAAPAVVPPPAPASATAASSAFAPATRSRTSTKAATKRPSAPKPASTDSAKARKKVQAARAAAERDGQSLQRPRESRAGAAVAATTRTRNTAAGTVRVTTAQGDLTGQGDQLMAADRGLPAGHARCTQQIRLSDDAEPKKIPTMLLCWRTSATRSVVTVAVVRKGRPAASASAALIDREWAELG